MTPNYKDEIPPKDSIYCLAEGHGWYCWGIKGHTGPHAGFKVPPARQPISGGFGWCCTWDKVATQ